MAEDSGSNERDVQSHQSVENVVLVVLDTARKGSISPSTMPTLTQLEQVGTTFDNAFTTAPWTLPSHASLFTGTYTATHGAHGGHTYLRPSLHTLAEAFQSSGYETVGVSNNTWITEEFGFDRGFDQLRRGWQYIQSDVDMGAVVRGETAGEKLEIIRSRLFEGNPLVNAANVLYSEVAQPAGDDGADRTTDWILEWLKSRPDDRPFFLFANYIEPHIVYEPPEAFAEPFLPTGWTYEEATAIRQDPRAFDCDQYEITDEEFAALRGLYHGELAYVDHQLERLCRGLDALGYWEDTMVVVCGDHGENIGDHGFLGHQYNLYDTLLQVPLVIHGGRFTGGGSREDFAQLHDLPETLLTATGVEDPALSDQSEGYALQTSTNAFRDAVFAEYVSPQPGIDRLADRFGDLPAHVYQYDRSLEAIRTHDYKYVRGNDGFERLHDCADDPGENTNLVDTKPAVARELRNRLETQFGDSPTRPEVRPEMREGTKDRLADLGYL